MSPTRIEAIEAKGSVLKRVSEEIRMREVMRDKDRGGGTTWREMRAT